MSTERASLELREGDVFSFHYSQVERAKRFMPDHCFDGQFVVIDGRLFDSYWLHGMKRIGGEDRSWTLAQALERGELTFKCNLGDVEIVGDRINNTQYFNDADVFNLSYQHGCYPCYAVRKGAQRSQEKMADVLAKRISDERATIAWATRTIERLTADAEKVQRGELSEVYL